MWGGAGGGYMYVWVGVCSLCAFVVVVVVFWGEGGVHVYVGRGVYMCMWGGGLCM